MGFFDKVKNKLGIGGVKLELQVPGQVAKDSGQLEGKLVLTTKSVQEVIEIEIKLKEEFSTGRGDAQKTKTFELGAVKLDSDFTIHPGETKELNFTLPFALLKSNADDLEEMGGAFGMIGKMGKFAKNEQSSYFVQADVDVKAAVLDPTTKKEVRMV